MSLVDQNRKLEEAKKRNKEEYFWFRTALDQVGREANGIIVLKHLAKICGAYKSSIVLTGGSGSMDGIDPLSVVYNEGRRSVYLDVRRVMTDETRRTVESKEIENEQTLS